MVAKHGCDPRLWPRVRKKKKKVKKWMENDKIIKGTVKLNKKYKLNKIEEIN